MAYLYLCCMSFLVPVCSACRLDLVHRCLPQPRTPSITPARSALVAHVRWSCMGCIILLRIHECACLALTSHKRLCPCCRAYPYWQTLLQYLDALKAGPQQAAQYMQQSDSIAITLLAAQHEELSQGLECDCLGSVSCRGVRCDITTAEVKSSKAGMICVMGVALLQTCQ